MKIPLAVGWVMCDPAVAAFAGCCVAEVVADGHFALVLVVEEVPA